MRARYTMSSSTDLDRWGKRRAPHFLGTYGSDELPPDPPPGSSLVVNYSKRHAPDGGTHWVAMTNLNVRGEPSYYFDSYGLPPDFGDKLIHKRTAFAAYLRRHSGTGRYVFNDRDYESLTASTCGHYAVYAAVHGTPQQPAAGPIGSPTAHNAWVALDYSRNPDKTIRRLVDVPIAPPS